MNSPNYCVMHLINVLIAADWSTVEHLGRETLKMYLLVITYYIFKRRLNYIASGVQWGYN